MNMSMKHIYLIIVLVIIISGAAFLLMNKSPESQTIGTTTPSEQSNPSQPPVISQPSGSFKCDDLYDEIENDLNKTNYCQVDSDCDVIMLGGPYIKFGCYHFINKNLDKQQFYSKMNVYSEKCSQMINKCAPAPEVKCVSNKCVYIKEE